MVAYSFLNVGQVNCGQELNIEDLCRKCTSCGQFQNKPDYPSVDCQKNHVKTPLCDQLSGKKLVSPCRRLFKMHSSNNLNVSKSTTAYLNKNAHFGSPHVVTEKTFMSQEFQAWCIVLTGAPYHPATNGAAEREQSFKQASSLPPKEALQEFLMQYRRIPFATVTKRIVDYAPKLTLWFHFRISCREDSQDKRASIEDSEVVSKVEHHYTLGDPC